MPPLPTLLLSAGALLPADENPREFGLVRWTRDLEAGLREAKRTEKPLLLLFQESPG